MSQELSETNQILKGGMIQIQNHEIINNLLVVIKTIILTLQKTNLQNLIQLKLRDKHHFHHQVYVGLRKETQTEQEKSFVINTGAISSCQTKSLDN